MCRTETDRSGSYHESHCCGEMQGRQQDCHRGIPKSWNREQRIEFYRHRINCFQEQIKEAEQSLEEIEKDERS